MEDQQNHVAKRNSHLQIRLMVGLLLLKQLENLSDENIVLQFKRNPYYRLSEATTPQTEG